MAPTPPDSQIPWDALSQMLGVPVIPMEQGRLLNSRLTKEQKEDSDNESIDWEMANSMDIEANFAP